MKAAVLEQHKEQWREDAIAAIVGISRGHEFFTADDIRGEMPAPAHRNWTGQALIAAKNLGLIEAVGYQTSRVKSRKHGVTRTWRKKET
ncbi:hypothetical protein AB0O52_17420 [Arthrobacter sp. NPDC080073]|uniref:hypothetical protein n=1 Tax=Arthrobacter sp. NPDC080073 TaxID=3155919 RepID=UPI0034125282